MAETPLHRVAVVAGPCVGDATTANSAKIHSAKRGRARQTCWDHQAGKDRAGRPGKSLRKRLRARELAVPGAVLLLVRQVTGNSSEISQRA